MRAQERVKMENLTSGKYDTHDMTVTTTTTGRTIQVYTRDYKRSCPTVYTLCTNISFQS